MPTFDLALIDGQNWDAAALNAVEAIVNRGRTFCTSATRPAAPQEGDVIFETDTLQELTAVAAAWRITADPGLWRTYGQSWSATGGSAPTYGNAIAEGKYVRIGNTCSFRSRLFMGSTTTYGTAPNKWRIGVPFATSGAMWPQPVDCLYVNTATGGELWQAAGFIDTSSANATLALHANTNGVSLQWAAGHYLIVQGTYECAT